MPFQLTSRSQATAELFVLFLATPLFLVFAPRDSVLYITLAVLFLGYIMWGARKTRKEIWGAPKFSLSQRRWHSWRAMILFTVPIAILFWSWGLKKGWQINYLHMVLALSLYLLWALIQQIIFQFYFLGRLRVALPDMPVYLLVILNGLAYGLVHYPYRELILLTSLGGIIWSYYYERDRLILPIAASHAILGVTYYYFVAGEDLIALILSRWSWNLML